MNQSKLLPLKSENVMQQTPIKAAGKELHSFKKEEALNKNEKDKAKLELDIIEMKKTIYSKQKKYCDEVKYFEPKCKVRSNLFIAKLSSYLRNM